MTPEQRIEARENYYLRCRQSICEPLMLARKNSAPSPDTLRQTTIDAPDRHERAAALCNARGWPEPVRVWE
jgi:hypothetical protein